MSQGPAVAKVPPESPEQAPKKSRFKRALQLFDNPVVIPCVAFAWIVYLAISSGWAVPFVIGASVLIAVVILWKVPQWQVKQIHRLNSAERFDRINEARKTLATILGGITLLIGGYFTWQNLNLAREGQVTDRFSKSIEQIGAIDANGKKRLEIRLGGIHALERIAAESEKDYWPIMEVLCTYVRENAPRQREEKGVAASQSPALPNSDRVDIQAILNVLGRRNTKFEKSEVRIESGGVWVSRERPDLENTDLEGLTIAGNYTHVDFYQADLKGSHLYDAILVDTSFIGANLQGAELSGTYLRTSNLGSANLTSADMMY